MRIPTQAGFILVVALVAVAVAWVASSAPAQDPASPAESQYTAPIPAEAGESGSDEEPTGMRSNIGSFPFTGLDLLILGVVTSLVALTGFLLRRLSAPRRPIR